MSDEISSPETAAVVLEFIRANPTTSVRAIAQALNMGRTTANRAINRLTRDGALRVLRQGTGDQYPSTYEVLAAAVAFPHFEDDIEAGAGYICLTSKPVARTVEVCDWINVDVDADGQAVGVELLVNPMTARIDELGRAAVWARSRNAPHPLTADALHRYAVDRTAWLRGQPPA